MPGAWIGIKMKPLWPVACITTPDVFEKRGSEGCNPDVINYCSLISSCAFLLPPTAASLSQCLLSCTITTLYPHSWESDNIELRSADTHLDNEDIQRSGENRWWSFWEDLDWWYKKMMGYWQLYAPYCSLWLWKLKSTSHKDFWVAYVRCASTTHHCMILQKCSNFTTFVPWTKIYSSCLLLCLCSSVHPCSTTQLVCFTSIWDEKKRKKQPAEVVLIKVSVLLTSSILLWLCCA